MWGQRNRAVQAPPHGGLFGNSQALWSDWLPDGRGGPEGPARRLIGVRPSVVAGSGVWDLPGDGPALEGLHLCREALTGPGRPSHVPSLGGQLKGQTLTPQLSRASQPQDSPPGLGSRHPLVDIPLAAYPPGSSRHSCVPSTCRAFPWIQPGDLLRTPPDMPL